MSGDRVWLTVGIPIYSKGVRWCWGQGSEQTSQLLLHLLGKPFIYGSGFLQRALK